MLQPALQALQHYARLSQMTCEYGVKTNYILESPTPTLHIILWAYDDD